MDSTTLQVRMIHSNIFFNAIEKKKKTLGISIDWPGVLEMLGSKSHPFLFAEFVFLFDNH